MKKSILIVGGVVVAVAVVLIVFLTMGGDSENATYVRNKLNADTLAACMDEGESSDSECEAMSECVVGKMLDTMTTGEVDGLADAMRASPNDPEVFSNYMSSLGPERGMAIAFGAAMGCAALSA
jgi:hypothetical protein